MNCISDAPTSIISVSPEISKEMAIGIAMTLIGIRAGGTSDRGAHEISSQSQ
jgi:hypothetical protein